MAHVEYGCPNCESVMYRSRTAVSSLDFKPLQTITCKNCLAQVPWFEMIRKYLRTESLGGGGAQFSGTPPTVVGSGSFYDETHNTTVVTIPAVTALAGQTILVAAMISDDIGATGAVMLWNGLNPDGADESTTGTPTAGGSYYAAIDVVSSATSDVTITCNNPFSTINSCAAVALVVPNTRAPSMDAVAVRSSFGSGTGTTSSTSQDGTPSRIPAIAIAANGTLGPLGDVAGSWTDSFMDLVRVGTAGATDTKNSTMSVGFKFLTSQIPVNVGKAGFTNRQWCVIQRPLKLVG